MEFQSPAIGIGISSSEGNEFGHLSTNNKEITIDSFKPKTKAKEILKPDRSEYFPWGLFFSPVITIGETKTTVWGELCKKLTSEGYTTFTEWIDKKLSIIKISDENYNKKILRINSTNDLKRIILKYEEYDRKYIFGKLKQFMFKIENWDYKKRYRQLLDHVDRLYLKSDETEYRKLRKFLIGLEYDIEHLDNKNEIQVKILKKKIENVLYDGVIGDRIRLNFWDKVIKDYDGIHYTQEFINECISIKDEDVDDGLVYKKMYKEMGGWIRCDTLVLCRWVY